MTGWDDAWRALTSHQALPVFVGALTLLAGTAALLHVLLHKRDTRAVIAWVGLVALVPLLGAIIYLVLGINRIKRKAFRLRRTASEAYSSHVEDDAWQARMAAHATRALPERARAFEGVEALVERVTGLPLLLGNRLELLRDGDEAYPQMLDAIAAAEDTIMMSTYIFDRDAAGQRFIDALGQAAARGVEVRVIIDSVGAKYSIPSSVWALRRAGVDVRTFLPILLPWKFSFSNLRTHRKILVVDGALGFTGGINIRHGHVLGEQPKHPTRDTHFRVEGPVVYHLQQTLAEDWAFVSGELLDRERLFPPLPAHPHGALARGVPDGPDEDLASLQWVLLGALGAARERVVIITPYFLPDESLIDALQVTAMRGVTVDIILPERSNLPFVDWASAPLWGPLMEQGCRVWLAPAPFDHSKLMVIDGLWSLIGSANWDPRSLRLNFEFNVECYDEALARAILALADAKLTSAQRVDAADHARRSIAYRIRDGIFRLATPYL